MLKVRRGVFETNSSSTHTMTMCDDDTYTKWMNNEIYWDNDNDVLVKEDEMFAEIAESYGDDAVTELKAMREQSEETFLDSLAEYSYYTRKSFREAHTYEHFHDKFVTAGGETVHTFGWYGEDY